MLILDQRMTSWFVSEEHGGIVRGPYMTRAQAEHGLRLEQRARDERESHRLMMADHPRNSMSPLPR